jgi:protein-S-isoprenylcysteine O-methyltransferase Ste14
MRRHPMLTGFILGVVATLVYHHVAPMGAPRAKKPGT